MEDRDEYGQPIYQLPRTVTARVVGKRRTLTNSEGIQVVSSHTVYLLGPNTQVGPHDRITLSTGDVHSTELGARQPKIVAVGSHPDEIGVPHFVVYLA